MTKKPNLFNAVVLFVLMSTPQQEQALRAHLDNARAAMVAQKEVVNAKLCIDGAAERYDQAALAAVLKQRTAELQIAQAELKAREEKLAQLELEERSQPIDDGREPGEYKDIGEDSIVEQEPPKKPGGDRDEVGDRDKVELLEEQHKRERAAQEEKMREIQERFEEKREGMDEQQREADMQKLEEQKEKVRQMQAERQEEQLRAAELAREQAEKQAIAYREASEREL